MARPKGAKTGTGKRGLMQIRIDPADKNRIDTATRIMAQVIPEFESLPYGLTTIWRDLMIQTANIVVSIGEAQISEDEKSKRILALFGSIIKPEKGRGDATGQTEKG